MSQSTASGTIRRCSFYEEATICVVLVPVWSDDTKFERMARLLRRIDRVNVRELLRSGSPWVSGIVRLRYVDYAVVQSDWDAFQGFRKVLGVIGIGDCTEEDNMLELNAKFQNTCKAYPCAASTLLFGVAPSEATANMKVPGDAVLVPSAEELEASPDRMDMLLRPHVASFVANILDYLERETFNTDDLGAYVKVPTDGQLVDQFIVESLKKWKEHRLLKLRGDWCVQAAQYDAACKRYMAASDKARGASDWVWVGGAQEGLAVATLCRARDPAACCSEVTACVTEALSQYNRQGATWQELELQVRFARYLGDIGQRAAAAERLAQVAYRAAAAAQLSITLEQRISICGEIAEVYKDMGFRRKSALFVRVVADLYTRLARPSTALVALRLCAPVYGLASFFDHAEATQQHSHQQQQEQQQQQQQQQLLSSPSTTTTTTTTTAPRDGTWETLQRAVLWDAVAVAKQMHDPVRVALYAQHLLTAHHAGLAAAEQQQLAGDVLWAASLWSRPLALGGRVRPLTPVVAVAPRPLAPSLEPRAPQGAARAQAPRAAARSPFLYNPHDRAAHGRRAEAPRVTWVAGELCRVDVTLENPLRVPVVVENIELTLAPSPAGAPAGASQEQQQRLQCFFQPVLLAPQQKPTCVGVQCRAAVPGEMVIDGCVVEAMGVRTGVRIDANGAVLPAESLGGSSSSSSSSSAAVGRKVTVLAPLPRLDVREVSSHSPTKLVLLENQVVDYEVELHNTGSVPIRALDITFAPQPSSNTYTFQRLAQRGSSSSSSSSALPIMPHERRTVVLHLLAKKSAAVTEVHFAYAAAAPGDGSNAAYTRDALLAIQTTVAESVVLQRVECTLSTEDERRCRVAFVVRNDAPECLTVHCAVAPKDAAAEEEEEEEEEEVRQCMDTVALRPGETGVLVVERARMVPDEEALETVAFFPDSYRNAHFVNPEDRVSRHNVHRPAPLPVRLSRHAHAALFRRVRLTWASAARDRVGVVPIDPHTHLAADTVRPLYVSPVALQLLDDSDSDSEHEEGEDIKEGEEGVLVPLVPRRLTAVATSVFAQPIADALRLCFSVRCVPSDPLSEPGYVLHGTPVHTVAALPAHGTAQHSITLIALPSATAHRTVVVTARLTAVWGTVFSVSRTYTLRQN